MPHTSKHAICMEFRMPLGTQTLFDIGTLTLKNAFKESCDNKFYAYKKLIFCLENYIIYNFFWPDKLSNILTYIN